MSPGGMVGSWGGRKARDPSLALGLLRGTLLNLRLFESRTWPCLLHQVCSLPKQMLLGSGSWSCSKAQVPGVLKVISETGLALTLVLRRSLSLDISDQTGYQVLPTGYSPPSSWSAVV